MIRSARVFGISRHYPDMSAVVARILEDLATAGPRRPHSPIGGYARLHLGQVHSLQRLRVEQLRVLDIFQHPLRLRGELRDPGQHRIGRRAHGDGRESADNARPYDLGLLDAAGEDGREFALDGGEARRLRRRVRLPSGRRRGSGTAHAVRRPAWQHRGPRQTTAAASASIRSAILRPMRHAAATTALLAATSDSPTVTTDSNRRPLRPRR